MASQPPNLLAGPPTGHGTAVHEVDAPVDIPDIDLDVELPVDDEDLPLPDPPAVQFNDMKTGYHLSQTGNMHHLIQHLKSQGKFNDETLVSTERYILRPSEKKPMAGSRYPDLMVAFGVRPKLYDKENGYRIAQQGRPPDFVLEIGSKETGRNDIGVKREDYQSMGIPEYWRFDDTEDGSYHGERLAGDRLVEGRYEPIDIRALPGGNLEGYSEKLDLHLRWESGELVFYDPATGRPILTYNDQKLLAAHQTERAEAAEKRAGSLEVERDAERERAEAAEAENRRLREQLRRVDSES